MTTRGRPTRAAEASIRVIRTRLTESEFLDTAWAASTEKTSISELIRNAIKAYIKALNTPVGRSQ